MTSSELRIGNYVATSNFIYIIKEVGEKDVRIKGIDLDYDYNYPLCEITYLKPIQLTEEWLLKFGFKEYIDFGCKTKQFDLLPLQGFSYNIDNKKVRVMHKGNSQSHWLKNSIEYVHQLQNLYFALTGEELKIK